jgi:hypothetical protein
MKSYNNVQIIPVKTYASYANAEKAAVNAIPEDNIHYQRFFITCNKEGRFFPVFIGEKACQEGLHFHFNVIA